MERTADKRIHTTEWEDVQYKYGNRVGKYETMEMQILTQKIADQNQNATLKVYDANEERVTDKLERGGYELADEKEEGTVSDIEDSDDDDDALAAIRRKRIMELKRQAEIECFGVLRHVPGTDYVKEVTESSEKTWVVALLIKPGHSDSEALLKVMATVAQRHRDTKVVSMISTEAIPNFPDRHLPCALLYHEKKVQSQVSGLAAWKQAGQLNVASVEAVLTHNGVLRKEAEDSS